MTTYTVIREEAIQEGIVIGREEGKEIGIEIGREEATVKERRFTIIKGKWRNISLDLLAAISDLQYSEIEQISEGYDWVFQIWQTNGKNNLDAFTNPYLSNEEVLYILSLLEQDTPSV